MEIKETLSLSRRRRRRRRRRHNRRQVDPAERVFTASSRLFFCPQFDLELRETGSYYPRL